jgi:hypothetical protein
LKQEDIPRGEAILKWLAVEVAMTRNHLAKLLPEAKGVKRPPLKITSMPKGHPLQRTREYAGTYSNTDKALKALLRQKRVMVSNPQTKDGEVKNKNAPQLWFLPTKTKLCPVGFEKRRHEICCVDFLCSLMEGIDFDTDRLNQWNHRWSEDELAAYPDPDKFYFDRKFVFDDELYFVEMDMGTKSVSAIRKQFQKYVDFSNRFHKIKFKVLIIARNTTESSDEARADWFLRLLPEYKRGDQFLVTLYGAAIANPYGQIWVSPADTSAPKAFYDF